jgi:hypothetical protein
MQQMILDSIMVKFRGLRLSLARLSKDALLPGRATNAWAVGASADDVSTLPSLGEVVWTVGSITLEHIGQFILQCDEASANDVLKLRIFPLSLSNTTFTWFTSLTPNSIFTWAQLEQNFHQYFF